jgi:hypothetical protein
MFCDTPFFIIVSVPAVGLNLTVVPLGALIVGAKEVLPKGDGVEVVPPKRLPPNSELFCWLPPKMDEVVAPNAPVVDCAPNVLVVPVLGVDPKMEGCDDPNNGCPAVDPNSDCCCCWDPLIAPKGPLVGVDCTPNVAKSDQNNHTISQ